MTEWSEAWRSLVEGSDPRVARRLHQGRAYHRAGRVTDVRIAAGGASARVQGDRATPFSARVEVPALSDANWERVTDALASQVRHTARLLAGLAPESLDPELEAKGVRIVPVLGEIETECDCVEATWPCAHIVALWEALAETLETDPFALLKMRGRGRERLLSELGAARRRRTHGEVVRGTPIAELDTAAWQTLRGPIDDLVVPEPPEPRTPAGTLQILGDPPGWAGGVGAWDLFHPLVAAAAEWVRALDDD